MCLVISGVWGEKSSSGPGPMTATNDSRMVSMRFGAYLWRGVGVASRAARNSAVSARADAAAAMAGSALSLSPPGASAARASRNAVA